MDPISALVNDIIAGHYAYISDCERKSTERAKQIALLKVRTKELQAKTELAEKYFAVNMQDRERLFQSALRVLDKAMENGDVEYAQIASIVIKSVNSKSPFSFSV